MKKIVYRVTLAAAALGLLAGCSAKGPKAGHVTVVPSSLQYIVPADSVDSLNIDLTLHLPAHYLSQRSRLIILPQLQTADSVIAEYPPVVLESSIYKKKRKRLEVLKGYSDSYGARAVTVTKTSQPNDIRYKEIVAMPEGVDSARIVGVVTLDGCGICTGIDTVEMASLIASAPIEPAVEYDLNLVWMEPVFKIRSKEVKGKGEALLQFAINNYDINLSLGDNGREFERMVSTLTPIMQDSLATLTSLDIYGMASADGSLAFNTELARNRAESAKQMLIKRLDIPEEMRNIIKSGSRPEGWQPVLDAMIAASDPDTTAVKNILTKYAGSNDDVQERYIRRLPAWNRIRSRYLQKDRKVEYIYTYTVKNFTTDSELLEMYGKRPDAFNEDELLRVATLMPDTERKKEVYLLILGKFPLSEVAANNLAVLYLMEDNRDEARKIIEESRMRREEAGYGETEADDAGSESADK